MMDQTSYRFHCCPNSHIRIVYYRIFQPQFFSLLIRHYKKTGSGSHPQVTRYRKERR